VIRDPEALLDPQDRLDLKARLDQSVRRVLEVIKVQLAIKALRVPLGQVALEADRVLQIWSTL